MNTTDPYFVLANKLGCSREELIENCRQSNAQVVLKEVDRGDGRKAHYGAGEQPWDTMLKTGWAPAFAAGNVLKYLRREKAVEHSRESARWYYDKLSELAEMDKGIMPVPNGWVVAMALQYWRELNEILLINEKDKLVGVINWEYL